MSACEKCWSDAGRETTYGGSESKAQAYNRLMEERKANPCTPEQQAGQDADECPFCHRMTLHQWTKEPMCGCYPATHSHSDPGDEQPSARGGAA